MEDWAALQVEDLNDIRSRLPNLPQHGTTVPLLLQILVESNMVQYVDEEEEAPLTLTMTLPVTLPVPATADGATKDLSEEDDDEDEQEAAVDTSDGS
eukprot:1978847-Rhodomonas_salina.1